MSEQTTKNGGTGNKLNSLVRYSFDEFKNGEVRIDFRNYTGRELCSLRNLCATVQPTRMVPSYSFGECYYCKDGEWFEGGAHQLNGDTCRALEIDLPNAPGEPRK